MLLLIKLVNNISMLNIENMSSATIFVHCRAIFSNEFALRILRNGEVEMILGNNLYNYLKLNRLFNNINIYQ